MTGMGRRAIIEQRRSAVLRVNDRFHQEQTLENNRGMTGSRTELPFGVGDLMSAFAVSQVTMILRGCQI